MLSLVWKDTSRGISKLWKPGEMSARTHRAGTSTRRRPYMFRLTSLAFHEIREGIEAYTLQVLLGNTGDP